MAEPLPATASGFELPSLREPPTLGARLVRRAVGLTVGSLAVIATAGATALSIFEIDVALDAAGVLEPRHVETVRSPVLGVVAEVEVAAGDRVEPGQPVARLDAFALRASLEQMRLEVRHKRHRRETSRQELESLEQRIAAAELELERHVLHSPIAGSVLTEELERKVGSRLAEGDLLLEVGSLDVWRARLLVAERDVHLIAVGDPVKIEVHAVTALDTWRHELIDASVTFVGTDPLDGSGTGGSFYRVFADLDGDRLGDHLRARFRRGMSVEARVITRSAPALDVLIRFFRRSVAA